MSAVNHRGLRLPLLLLWLLLISVNAHASLTESSAGELYSRWQQLPKEEQLPALVDLVAFYSRRDTNRAIALADLALLQTSDHTPPALIASLRNDRAFALFMSGQVTKALAESINNEHFAKQHELLAASGRAAMIQGFVYQQANLPEQALVAQQRALHDFERVNEPERLGWVLKELATLLIHLRQFAQVEAYLQQIENIAKSPPQLPTMSGALAEVRGLLASTQKKHQVALEYYLQALSFAKQANDAIGQHVFHAAIGHELLLLKRPTDALHYAEQGLTLMQATGSSSRDVNLLRIKANALLALSRADEASQLLLALVEKATERNDQANLAVLWQDLYEFEKKRGRFEQALQYLERERQAELMVTDENSAQRAALLDAAFNNERKTRQIELLQSENRVQQLEIEQQQQRLIVAVTVGLLLIATTLFFYLRRQHQHELKREQQLNAKLRELDGIKDRMLANTSHELRTPLNGIVGLSELLLTEKLDEHVREYVELIADSGRRLTDVVTDLLESARLREGKIQLNRVALAIHEPAHKALLICSPLAQKKRLTLIDRLPANLPPVMADPARVQQILINLLTNAIKFTEQGSISVHAEALGDKLKVSVQDTGIGVPTEMRERIFDSFVQADGTMSRRHEGTGLGLAISKQLVELHGGSMGVNSTEGSGSVFWFTLPTAGQAG